MNATKRIKRQKNPRQGANPFSVSTFFYTIPTFIKGCRKPFEEEDLYETLREHQSEFVTNKIEDLWEKQIENTKRKPSLVRVLISAFGFEFCAYGLLLGIAELLLKPAQAVFLGRLLLYYMPTTSEDLPMTQYEARIYAGAIVLMSFLYILTFHPLMVHIQMIGLKAKIGCSSLIYRKALKLNRGAFDSTSVGQIVNMISTDGPMFIICAFLLNYIWIGPLQCCIVTYLMYQEVGFSTIFGIVLLFLLIPIHHLLGKTASKFRWKAAARTDDRVCYMDEVLSGIKAIKMYAWEGLIKGVLVSLRNFEMKYLRLSMYLKAANICFDVLIIPVVIYVTILVYVMHNDIRADKVFTLMLFFNSLRATMASTFPQAVAARAVTLVSIKRIENFLMNPEIQLGSIDSTKDPIAIRITNGHARWGETPTLKDVNLTVNPGRLVAIVGQVGCGKSSLLNVMLKELCLVSGTIHINGQISYASQDAWLFSGSIRDNILFGEEMDSKRYYQVVRACALEDDFSLLPFADQSIVGGRGASLSGGQRARISLARAVYKDADIYLLDEPLAAVDARVAQHIFDKCIRGFLKGKTVVLVTHQLKYLKDADEIIAMDDGTIANRGRLAENEIPKSVCDQDSLDTKAVNESNLANGKGDFVQDIVKEQKSLGSVSNTVYKRYVTASGYLSLALVMVLFVLTQVLVSSGPYFLTHWVNKAQFIGNPPQAIDYSKTMYIYIYSAITIACVVIVSLRSYSFFSLLLRSSQKLHNNMFNKVIGGSMHFFNTNPQGRILNRFSQDIGAVDTQLPNVMIDTTQQLLAAFGAVMVVAIVNYWLIIPTAVLGIISYGLKRFCLLTSRNIKRLEGVTRSPVFEHLSSSMQGLSTIRAFQAETILKKEFDCHQDLHTCCAHLFLSSSQGFGYFLDCLCTVYIAIVTLSFVISDDGSLSGDVGLAITQSITLMGYLQWGVLQTAELENNMTSVERILEYDSIEQEDTNGNDARETWPESGKIVFRKVSLKYSKHGLDILNNLNFEIAPNENVGIIGRTGAGKSSIINALLRLSYTTGEIFIDGIDIASLSLKTLRSKISVIPQDPTLFSGTLRQALDPFEEYEDNHIWNALEEVELRAFFANLPHGLNHTISQGGANLSVGQRQLICLARAILRNNKILIMDEATANVDLETDNFVQRTIRKKFKDCTVLTIAHRLQTVIDSDRVLVMNAGEIIEFDKPSKLLSNTNGYFYKIVQQLNKDDSII